MHPRIRSADTSVTIAPRLPVNPFGKFGPCSTDLPPPAPSLSSMPTWRATAQNCGVTLRSSGGREGQEGAGKGWGESLGVWMEDGERHVRCEEFASADYYPEDWILLDEVQGWGANAHTYFPLYPSTHLPAHTRCLSCSGFRWCVRARADARPPHSLHLLLSRWCRQMPAPPHSLQCLLLCGACSRCIGLLPSPALAGATAADVRCLVRYSMQRAVPVFLLAARRAARRHSTALHG